MRVTVSIPDPIGGEAEKAAREEGMSLSAVVAQAVERYLEERRRDKALQRIASLIGTARVAADAVQQLDRGRAASDRDAA